MCNLHKKILFFLIFCLFWLDAHAVKGPLTVNLDVTPGNWKAVRLKNLPRDAVIALEVKCDGEITVTIIDYGDYLKFPNVRRPLFRGRVQKKLSFSLTIPESDHYYVVLDNRSGVKQQAVTVTVAATRGKMDQINMANMILREFERQLHQIFIFEPFPTGVEHCDTPKAFDNRAGIVLCVGYVRQLYDGIGDTQQAKEALSFSIFHELSRVLLDQWKHPLSGKKSTADELAAVLMIMLNQTKTLSANAENFAQNPSISMALIQVLKDDRHPLTSQRARKILDWLKDPQLVRKWQNFLVPHMQTILLEKLQQHPTTWTDLPLVEKELAQRSQKHAHHGLQSPSYRTQTVFYSDLDRVKNKVEVRC
jgi:hypothetical protein